MPETLASLRVRDALAGAVERLARAGCETPRLDAELLLAAALGLERATLVIEADAFVGHEPNSRFQTLLARRLEREPVAYILGRKDFRRISLAVDRRVLVPRPETELLVEAALGLPPHETVVDVGTGSGAVALALKDERPDLEVTGTDLSAGAISLARANATRLGLDVGFVEGDLLAGIACRAVLANLPYVEEGAALAPEIERYEPTGALFAGRDGLDVIRCLVRALPEEVRFAALEIGAGQADDVAALLSAARFDSVERVGDLAGHERVLVGRR